MKTFQQYQQDISEHINGLLKSHIASLPDHAPRLKAAMEYALLIGGKRLRPFLLYATGEMLGVKRENLDGAAMAVECIHAYSLIHDDLPAMDDDDLRRGHPTCHIAFDEASAILAGDALQTEAYRILLTYPLAPSLQSKRVDLLRQLTEAAGYQGMCGGQAIDLAATGKQISLPELQQLHEKKTGAMLIASVTMACTLCPSLSDEEKARLADFAAIIGLAFQVQDDILDVIGDTQTLGKPQGSDQAQEKSTYPAMMGLQGAQDYLHSLHLQALQALQPLPYNTELLVSLADYIIQRNH